MMGLNTKFGNKFYYQLQNYNSSFVDFVSKTANSFWVIDFYFKGSTPFKISQIEKMKENDNKIFAYLSIGEAEDYRPYFKSISKNLIGAENPNWPGNFNVNYWSTEWHEFIYLGKDSYLKKIINTNFDGVYLDIIDAFERFPNKKTRAKEMAELVINISMTSKELNPDFKIIIQNGVEILDYLEVYDQKRLATAIDGISAEAYFFENDTSSKKSDYFKSILKFHRRFKVLNHNIALMAVEYKAKGRDLKGFKSFCSENRDYSCLISDLDLKGKYFEHP